MKRIHIDEPFTNGETKKSRNKYVIEYNQRRILNQVDQILNYSSNFYFDFQNLKDIIRIYGIILEPGVSNQFNNSLMDTLQLFQDKNNIRDKLASLKNNERDSFIIVPMFSVNHAFYGVARNINNELSFTIVNRGDRGDNYKYEEFIIKKHDEFIKLLKKIMRYNRGLSTLDIYHSIRFMCDRDFDLKVESSSQKTGNCFIKELESAIKYAFATRNESCVDIEKLRDNKETFTPKWHIPIEEIHKLYIQRVGLENPQLTDVLEEKYQKYLINKKLRKLIDREGFSIEVLRKLFGEDGQQLLISFFKNLDRYNFQINKNDIEKIVLNSNFEELKNSFDKLKKWNVNLKEKDIFRLISNEDLNELGCFFPVIAEQLREEYASMYYGEALKLNNTLEYDESIKISNKVIELDGSYALAYFQRGLAHLNNYDKNKAMADFKKSIELMPFNSEVYKEKSNLDRQLGDFDEYIKTCAIIFELEPDNKDICCQIAEEYYMKGKYKMALGWIEKAKKIEPDDQKIIRAESELLGEIAKMNKGRDMV